MKRIIAYLKAATEKVPEGGFLILAMAALATGCQRPAGRSHYLLFSRVENSSTLSSCPYLTRDQDGKWVLSWVNQSSDEAPGHLYYAISSDSGKSFGPPLPVPTATTVEPHGENMPKLVFLQDGRLVAIFGTSHAIAGNAYAGKIYATTSDNGRNWSPANPITGDSSSYDERYFDALQLPDDSVALVWLNDSRPAGSSLCYATMDSKGRTSTARILAEHTCQCCRTDLYRDASGGLDLAWRTIIQDSIRDMEFSRSQDNGKTFSAPARISPDNWVVFGCPHTGPSMVEEGSRLNFAWYTMGGGGGIYYCHRDLEGNEFSPREEVSRNPSSRHPQIISLPGSRMLIAWDEDMTLGTHRGRGIALQVRSGSGAFLRNLFILPKNGEASFARIAPLGANRVLLAYTRTEGTGSFVDYGDVTW